MSRQPEPLIPGRSLNVLGLRLPVRETAIVLVVTLVLIVDWYHAVDLPVGPQLSRGIQRLVLFGAVPLVALLLLHERPARYGLRIGDWRIGLAVAAGMAIAATPVILVVSGMPDFAEYYAATPSAIGATVLGYSLDVAAAEFLFRGFLMWSLIGLAGPMGVVLATFPFVFTHLGKPELEALSTFFGGLAFGWLAWRTRSVLYGALLHAYLLGLIVVLASR